jgi:hypothetical protein
VSRDAARDFASWMSDFAGASDCIGDMNDFCARFADIWDHFRADFVRFLEKRYGASPASDNLSDVLVEFHREHPDYRLRGCVVEGSKFSCMLRVARDIDLRFMLPDHWSDGPLYPEKLRSLSDLAFLRYIETWSIGGFHLCGKTGIVWAMDRDDVGAFAPNYPDAFSAAQARGALAKLGLVDMGKVTWVIVFEYPKGSGDEPIPRTPTPIDGLNHSRFDVVRPCNREGGWTRIAETEIGLPEAVHGCVHVSPNKPLVGRIREA